MRKCILFIRNLMIGIIFLIIPLSVSAVVNKSDFTQIDYIMINKKQRIMRVYKQGVLLRKYSIALGFETVGPKQFAEDGKTPEGIYKITAKNPNSNYHKSLRISYPTNQQIQFARAQNKSPGGDIMIHGLARKFSWVGKAHTLFDWTKGCIAVTNEQIDEIYPAVALGTTVEIVA